MFMVLLVLERFIYFVCFLRLYFRDVCFVSWSIYEELLQHIPYFYCTVDMTSALFKCLINII